MTYTEAKYIIRRLTDNGISFEDGLSEDEVLQIESKCNFKLPPDLRLFLQMALPTSDGFVNWRLALKSEGEADKIKSKLDWPLDGMLFDVKNNNFWIDSWGSKPLTYEEQAKITKEKYQDFPKLIPIYSHRYIPEDPSEEGNPVFSVYQMDIIYYGYNLMMYLSKEFKFPLPENFKIVEKPKNIEFWSSLVEG